MVNPVQVKKLEPPVARFAGPDTYGYSRFALVAIG